MVTTAQRAKSQRQSDSRGLGDGEFTGRKSATSCSKTPSKDCEFYRTIITKHYGRAGTVGLDIMKFAKRRETVIDNSSIGRNSLAIAIATGIDTSSVIIHEV